MKSAVRRLFPQAIANARLDAARPPAALVGVGLLNAHRLKAREGDVGLVTRHAHEPAVDHHPHALDGERRLCDRRREHDLAPARPCGCDGEILRARIHGAIERRDVDLRPPDPRFQHFRDATDLALPGQEGEDRAGFLVERLERRARDILLDARARVPAKVARGDRISAALAFDQRSVAKEGANASAVERRRHHQNAQVFTQAGLRVERQREAEIGVERALVELIEHDRADALERRVVEDHAGEDALRHDLDACLGRGEALEPHPKADRLADPLAQGCGHARGRGAGGEPARLEQQQALGPGPGLVEKGERRARRLAGPRRGDEHGARACAERGLEGPERAVDREGRGEPAHRFVLRGAGATRQGEPQAKPERNSTPGGRNPKPDERKAKPGRRKRKSGARR